MNSLFEVNLLGFGAKLTKGLGDLRTPYSTPGTRVT